MRRETQAERAAWTAFVEGRAPVIRENKYRAQRHNGFASRHEAAYAEKLRIAERAGAIRNLEFQVPVRLVEGRGKIRPIVYIADFRYEDNDGVHWVDAKGFKTPVYRLKKKLAALLLGIEIEEV